MDITQYLSETESASSLASRIGVAPALISQWKHGVRQVPAERCPDIERATAGQVTCEELRPDLAEQWAYLRNTNKEAA
jgi:DNA-binding transcriptional regulator YdaS (Cro superfamily)